MLALALPARRPAAVLALAAGLVGPGAAAAEPPGAAMGSPPPVAMGDPHAPPSPVVIPRFEALDPVMAEIGVRLGGAYRLGDGPSFGVDGRTGAMFGAGVAVAPSWRFAIGLAYEHVGLGSEHGSGDLGTVDLGRTLDSLWASVRLTLFRTEHVALAITLGPGLVWQSVDANVLVLGDGQATVDTFRCSETGGPGLGLRAGLGAEVRLGSGFFLSLDGVIDELRLSADPLGSCAPGAGSTAVVGVRGGLAYRIDVSRYTR